MSQCLQLAKKGRGHVSPNPMVGCVIVYNNEIIGEGFHEKYGGPHAEVNAINSVYDKDLLKESTLYVSLEPCAHFGLTPPCSDLIIDTKIPRVVIGTIDPFAKVSGRGIEKMQKSGIKVQLGILEKECKEINKRFFTYHEKHRPYIILKWAETIDGFIDLDRKVQNFGQPTWITGDKALFRVHELRAQEDAILVGFNTALKDNPSLSVRHCEGRNPVRIVIDNRLQLPSELKLFDNSVRTLVFNSLKSGSKNQTEYVRINFAQNIIPQILNTLYSLKIQSLIVEGGRLTLESFIKSGLWDETYRFIGNKKFVAGVKAPQINGESLYSEEIEEDRLLIYENQFNKV